MKKTTSPYILVRQSVIHGRGVFAKTTIPKGAKVIEYVGERITKIEAAKRMDENDQGRKNEGKAYNNVFIFELNKRHDIDGNVPYNTARFINHSCDPNTEIEIRRGKIWVIALRDIKKGEELSYNYGYDFEDYADFRCYCRTKQCVGFIMAEEHWPKLKRELECKKDPILQA
jgi:SET domain-containing protein